MKKEFIKAVKNNLSTSILILFSGCTTYRTQTQNYYLPRNDGYNSIRQEALENKLYNVIPRHREQVKLYDLPHWIPWALMGNDDNGIFGENSGKRPYKLEIGTKTFCSWTARNPMHNLFFYVPPLGTAGLKKHHTFSLIKCDNMGLKLFSTQKGSVFLEGNNTFQLSFYDFKPFISFKLSYSKNRRFDFYAGGRPEGAFGFKFRPIKKRK
ncbi:hypothetical protein HYW75_05800 [Candidatus Pacearchaeota archaeon]|nr:hypothetical protein [Candidatus Pacearchaeota archaeon]